MVSTCISSDAAAVWAPSAERGPTVGSPVRFNSDDGLDPKGM